MRRWTIGAIGALTVLLACSRPDDLTNAGDEPMPEYRVPLRTLPWLADFKLGTATAQSGLITHLMNEFSPGEPIYLSMKINAAPRGTIVTTYWYGPGNQVLSYETKTISSDQERMRFVQDNTLDWPEGNGCQDVERRNGKSFAKFVGTVQDVRDGKRIGVELPRGEELTFRPTPNTMLFVDGRRMRFGEIQEGTKLPFYIPEDRFRAELQPDPKRLAFVVVPIIASSVSSP